MTDHEAELGRLLRPLDPVASDPPPAQGSDRYRSILETAMHTDDRTPALTVEEPPTPLARRRPRRRWPYAVTAAAVVLAVGAVGALVVVRSDAQSPQVTVSDAVSGLEEITSLEAELTRIAPESTSTARIRVAGEAMQSTSRSTYADGHVEEVTQTVIDGFLYETLDGERVRTRLGAENAPAPFGPSSDAVLTAATSGSEITEVGPERVGDVEAVRYDIVPGADAVAALGALPPSQSAWFELEYPDQVDSLSVWIADGLIHQVEVVQGGRTIDDEMFEQPIDQPGQTTRTRFFNFNGDIRVTAPSGPYVESGG